MFYDEGGEALAQVARRGGRCPIPGNIPGQVGQGSAHPDPGEDVPARCRGSHQMASEGPFQPNPFCDSEIRHKHRLPGSPVVMGGENPTPAGSAWSRAGVGGSVRLRRSRWAVARQGACHGPSKDVLSPQRQSGSLPSAFVYFGGKAGRNGPIGSCRRSSSGG